VSQVIARTIATVSAAGIMVCAAVILLPETSHPGPALIAAMTGLILAVILLVAVRVAGRPGRRNLPPITPRPLYRPAHQCPYCGQQTGSPYYEPHLPSCPGPARQAESFPLVAPWQGPGEGESGWLGDGDGRGA
jgi:hypothetical protein